MDSLGIRPDAASYTSLIDHWVRTVLLMPVKSEPQTSNPKPQTLDPNLQTLNV